MQPTSVIERAFELARSSTTIDDIRNALKREGYSQVDAHLAGQTIRADLKKRFVG
jgi:tRNA G26 N,N-dimethylase Trm1